MNDWKNDPDRAAIEHIVRPLKKQFRLDDTFEERVMSAVHAEALARVDAVNGGTRAHENWWRRRYTLRFTALGGLALAASIMGVIYLGSLSLASPTLDPQSGPQSAVSPKSEVPVHFILVSESASQVYLVGDFNGWSRKKTPLTRGANQSAWTVTVPLEKGRHEYAFIVADENGEHWVADPLIPSVEDEFGTESSIVSVGATS